MPRQLDDASPPSRRRVSRSSATASRMCSGRRSGDVGCSSTTMSGVQPSRRQRLDRMLARPAASACRPAASAAGRRNGTSSPARAARVGDRPSESVRQHDAVDHARLARRRARCSRAAASRQRPDVLARHALRAAARRHDGQHRDRDVVRQPGPAARSARSGSRAAARRTCAGGRQRAGLRLGRAAHVADVQVIGRVVRAQHREARRAAGRPSSSSRVR